MKHINAMLLNAMSLQYDNAMPYSVLLGIHRNSTFCCYFLGGIRPPFKHRGQYSYSPGPLELGTGTRSWKLIVTSFLGFYIEVESFLGR